MPFLIGYDPGNADYTISGGLLTAHVNASNLLTASAFLAIGWGVATAIGGWLGIASVTAIDAQVAGGGFVAAGVRYYHAVSQEHADLLAAIEAALATGNRETFRDAADALRNFEGLEIAAGSNAFLGASLPAILGLSGYNTGWAGGSLNNAANTFTVQVGGFYAWNPAGGGGAGCWQWYRVN